MPEKSQFEKLKENYLNICEGTNGESCGGDPSVGIFPCPYYDSGFGCTLKDMPSPSGFTEFAREVHENAVAHGWWDQDRGFPEILALCHSELSEALEEHRNGKPLLYFACKNQTPNGIAFTCNRDCARCEHGKPEGAAVEMADCMIRILDWCGKEGVDIDAIIHMKHEYNKTRPYKHGGKVC
jgi:hypothetical protein